MGGLGIKAIMIAVAVITVTGAATAGVMHYNTLVSERAELEAAHALVKSELESQQSLHTNYVQSTVEQIVQLQEDLTALSAQYAEERRKSEALSKLFSRHNLTKLATKKPGLIGNRVNSGTQRLWDSLEASTRRQPRAGEASSQSGVPAPGSD